MIDMNISLKNLRMAVSSHNQVSLLDALDNEFARAGQTSDIHQAMLLGLEDVRQGLMSNQYSIPEFLLCVDTLTKGMERLSRMGTIGKSTDESQLVIGVVEGDPHDLGKNIIAAIYRVSGYNVTDLGWGVPGNVFVENVLARKAKVLALSAMMSTTASAIRNIAIEIRAKSPETVIMTGGAHMDRKLAMKYGAHGFADSALTVIEETETALKSLNHAT